MKILTISVAAWDDTNSIGNTLSNWFGGGHFDLFNIYTRDTLPNNNYCRHYYQVTILDILRHLLCPWKIGRSFSTFAIKQKEGNLEVEVASNINGWKKRIIKYGVELLYSSNIWLNKKLKHYLDDVNPDIVFSFVTPGAFRYNLIRYIKKNTNAKIVLFVADAVYEQSEYSGIFKHIFQQRYKKMFEMCDKIYGASDLLCKEYHTKFGIDIKPLYKGCTIVPPKGYYNTPLRIVYAGNLLYGRSDTLCDLAECLYSINKERTVAQLEIYSPTNIDQETRDKLNVDGSSHLYNAKPYKEIVDIMHSADVVLHVESFEPEQIEKVRLSFSTKISDCIQSGSVLMVIGPKGIASVEYPRSIEGVIIVDNLSQLKDTLEASIKNPNLLLERASKLYNYAISHHHISNVRSHLMSDFAKLTNV